MFPQTQPITYDDYRTLPDDGNRYEIIGGELFMTSPITQHQRISQRIERALDNYIQEHKLGEYFHAPMDVVLSMRDVVQPDIFYISNQRTHIISQKNVVEAPDLVIEILSESTEIIDRTRKKTLYEKYGVNEYWIVDPFQKTVEQFTLENKNFELNARVEQSQTLVSLVMEGFTLPLDKVFSDQ
jgi:Uma2 family endonuclease